MGKVAVAANGLAIKSRARRSERKKKKKKTKQTKEAQFNIKGKKENPLDRGRARGNQSGRARQPQAVAGKLGSGDN